LDPPLQINQKSQENYTSFYIGKTTFRKSRKETQW